MLPDPLAREHAADVPVYVREAYGGYQLVDASGVVRGSGYLTARQALEAALGAGLARFTKTANLRTGGHPDGAWRWLDATATEDRADGGARISDRAIWDMAAGLNARASAIPINGGGAPDGLRRSEPHGDGAEGGDHPANGFAHVGVPVFERGRLHLYLRSELIPEVAAEVDRGRLAYGSVRIGFDHADPKDGNGMVGAELISHALTNDPAIKTLSPGSEHQSNHAHVAQFTRKSEMQDQIDPALYARFVEWARTVLNKPDATPEDVMAELEARAPEVGAVLGTDTQPTTPTPMPMPDPGGQDPALNQAQKEGEPTMSEQKETADSPSALRAELAAMRRDLETEKKQRREAEAKAAAAKQREDDAKWLDEQIEEKKLTVSKERHERLLTLTRTNGREAALEWLGDPPSAPELDHRAPATGTKGAAKPADRQVELVREAERTIRQEHRDAGRKMPLDHEVHRLAIQKAREEHPEAFKRAG